MVGGFEGFKLAAILHICGGASRPFIARQGGRSHSFGENYHISSNISSNHVTNIPRICPQCDAPISVREGQMSVCRVCHASQVHSEPNLAENWRRCPNCDLFFKAAPLQFVFCPNCQTNQVHPENDGIVKWERGHSAPRVHTDLSHPDTLFHITHNTGRTAFQLVFSWWQPYQAAIERFFVTLWPTSLFTFTSEERRALRLAARGSYKFSEINDPRLAKWLTCRGRSSAVSGLETIQPKIARHLVKTLESLRLDGIQFIDEQLAHSLVRHNGRTLYLDNLRHIDIEVLEILITHAGRGLSLGGLINLTIQEASILARYRGRLSLNSLSKLNSEVLAALVQHSGKSMSLTSLGTLSLSQAQQLKQYRGDLYLRGIRELPPGIDNEFIDFSGKIVLKHHERRPNQPYDTVDTPAESNAAGIALGIVTVACMAVLFALLVTALRGL